MTAIPATAKNDLAILSRIIRPGHNDFSVTAARAILKLDFDDEDRKRMHELSLKAQEGALNAEEEAEIEGYERAGTLLDLLHSKARRALRGDP
jgi:hypothetical protein